MTEAPTRYEQILAKSAIFTDTDLTPVWDTTTCQDMLHSLYCTHCELKALESQSAAEVIQILRPVFVKYHGRFFRNVGSVGTWMETKARRYIRRKHRKAFMKDFIGLKQSLT